MLWVLLCHQFPTLCYLNSNAQPTQDAMQKSPHFYNPRHTSIRTQFSVMLTHFYWCQSGARAMGITISSHQQLKYLCSVLHYPAVTQIGQHAQTWYSPVCFTCFIKNTSNSSHKKINNDLFALAGIIWKVKMWKLSMIRSLLLLQVARAHVLVKWFQCSSLQTSSYTLSTRLRKENEPQIYAVV